MERERMWSGSWERRWFGGAVLLLLALHGPGKAWEGDRIARVDALVEKERARQQIPGLAVAILQDGEVVHARGYGLANLEHAVSVHRGTVFQSGSVGKQFTAAAVMLLVEDGKVKLDDPIRRHLPEVPSTWERITIRHLLTHTSGTTDYPANFDFRRDYTEAELLAQAAALPLAFEPGSEWRYSNLGYVLLGIMIGRVSGGFYGEFLRTRLFEPLGMKTARIISEAAIVPHRSSGYRLVGGQWQHQAWVAPTLNTTADGSLYLTLDDMVQWERALLKGTLLRPESLAQTWTPVLLNNGKRHPYGFGWRVLDLPNGRRRVQHGGSWQGFKSAIVRFVEEKVTVILFANLAQVNPEQLALKIAGQFDPRLIPKETGQ
ncbi:MAG: serine hydrolase domain-containing protein [Blastocatellia bacterium]